jgi:hypothetical protein
MAFWLREAPKTPCILSNFDAVLLCYMVLRAAITL